MKSITETAIELVNSFYDETTIDGSIYDTAEEANESILADFELCKRLAILCAKKVADAFVAHDPSSFLGGGNKHSNWWIEIANRIPLLTMEDVFSEK